MRISDWSSDVCSSDLLQLAGQLTDAIRVIGGYAYVDAEVTRDNTLARGSRLLNVPRHSGSLLTTYEFLDGDLSGLSLGGAVKYVGDRAGQAARDRKSTRLNSSH